MRLARSAARAVIPDALVPVAAERLQGRPAARTAIRAARAGQRVEAPRVAYRPLVRMLAGDCHSVLDIGTGLMRSLAELPCPVRIGLEAHRPYLEHREVGDAVPLNASAADLERLFVADALDLVQLIDVLEHFDARPRPTRSSPRPSGSRASGCCCSRRGASSRRRTSTPSGLGGEEFQRHRSTWEPEDLERRGYRAVVMRGLPRPVERGVRRGLRRPGAGARRRAARPSRTWARARAGGRRTTRGPRSRVVHALEVFPSSPCAGQRRLRVVEQPAHRRLERGLVGRIDDLGEVHRRGSSGRGGNPAAHGRTAAAPRRGSR